MFLNPKNLGSHFDGRVPMSVGFFTDDVSPDKFEGLVADSKGRQR